MREGRCCEMRSNSSDSADVLSIDYNLLTVSLLLSVWNDGIVLSSGRQL